MEFLFTHSRLSFVSSCHSNCQDNFVDLTTVYFETKSKKKEKKKQSEYYFGFCRIHF